MTQNTNILQKSSPDDIVMIIHKYTWIDISGTISETVSHTLANGNRCMDIPDAWQRISIINPSLLPERDNEVKEQGENASSQLRDRCCLGV